MKNSVASALVVIVFITLSNTDSQYESTDDNKHITVTGSADVIVTPDEVELEILLREYDVRHTKKELDEIEAELVRILKQHGISQESIVLNDPNRYWYYWWGYRNEHYKQQRFNIKVKEITNMLELIKALNIKGVQSLRIAQTNHSDLQKFRKEVKIRAVQAAKEKATYLLESIDEEVGDVIMIEEMPTNNSYWNRNSMMVSNVSLGHQSNGYELEYVSDIKLQYSIKAKFEIKN